MMDDIPEAVRHKSRTQLRDKPIIKQISPPAIIVIGAGILALSIAGLISFLLLPRLTPKSSVESSPSPAALEATPKPTPTVENILGHLPYQEAPASELKAVTSNGSIRLRKGAAQKFQQMQAAARADGVILTLISGYRSIKDQEYLFFQVKEQRNQETRKRAEVSAPPGYSEHHTGYAVDLGDGKAPATNLNTNFANTAAFNWLKNNAAKYSFELSFPPNNPQGVSYEPWHWRYVGDSKSLETFYKAQQLKKSTSQGTGN